MIKHATLFRGTILNPLDEHQWEFFPDGGLQVQAGRITKVGHFKEVARGHVGDLQELDGLLIPGFVDIHIHWVQHGIRGQYHASLLEWLNQHVWVEEARYADEDYARQQAGVFIRDTLRAGTTLGLAYSSVHAAATRIMHEHATHAGADWIVGNSLMDMGAPQALLSHNLSSPQHLQDLLMEIGIDHYAVTPRFALNCSHEFLSALGDFVRRQGCFVQTHLSESTEEVKAVCESFEQCHDYTDVYDQCGLLTGKTILGHCIHLSDREWSILATRGCKVAHCPSSNEALDSGRMDVEKLREFSIPWALASDVGAGPSHSMLHVMQRFLAQHRAAGVRVTVKEALYRATLAGAECLERHAVTGNLATGKRADFVLLPKADPLRGDPVGWLEALLDGSPAELEQRPLGTWLSGSRVA